MYPPVAKSPFIPTDELRRMCEIAAASGLSIDECCVLFDITRPQFDQWLKDSYDVGVIRATAQVGGTLLRIATNENHKQCVSAAAFWLQSRAGWRTNANLHVNATVQADEATRKSLVEEVLRSLNPQAEVEKEPVPSKLN